MLGWGRHEDPGLTALLLLFAATMFAGATLLFVVQPMVGKMVLPLLGGAPAVWSTCMVFFQAALPGGYAYARFGDTMTFYEIDGLARDIATNRFYFSYVPDAVSRGDTVRIETGDARGLLVFHLSNRYLSLEPVVANLAEDAGLGGRLLRDDPSPDAEGATASTWAVLARTPEALGNLTKDEGWTAAKFEQKPRVGVWTDDSHNLLAVFKW